MSEALAISKTLTPQQILARLLTVDGVGSALDADYVRGLEVTGFQPGLGIGGTPTLGQVLPRALPVGLGPIRFSTIR